MISKELLSEVLELRSYIESIDESVDEKNIYYYSSYESYPAKQYSINIYELAHKCKEWANKKYKACLISGYCKGFRYKCFTDNPYGLQYIKKVETQTADTEPEAIFKACEWIMENQCK